MGFKRRIEQEYVGYILRGPNLLNTTCPKRIWSALLDTAFDERLFLPFHEPWPEHFNKIRKGQNNLWARF